jgi:hypothetical protein
MSAVIISFGVIALFVSLDVKFVNIFQNERGLFVFRDSQSMIKTLPSS